MATDKIAKKSQNDVGELFKKIDSMIDDYLKAESGIAVNQRIVNVGRALNAYHVCWVDNMVRQTNQANDKILFTPTELKNDKPFIKPSRSKK
jgi:hypothetical protein